ncbi:MAG: hypothetical protein AB9879_09700 [Methanothrix sp.]
MVEGGKSATIFTSSGESEAFTNEACSPTGETVDEATEFYIVDRDKSWWDLTKALTVKVAGTTVSPTDVFWGAGCFTIANYVSGAVTVSGYYFVPEWMGGGYGVKVEEKCNKNDVTTFPKTLSGAAKLYKQFAPGLKYWTMTIQRHYWYGRAWVLIGNLIFAWRSWGTLGNAEQVEVVEGAELAVSRASHKTTITVEHGDTGSITTEAEVKEAIEDDPTLNTLWEVSYNGVHTGTDILDAISAMTCSGGRDHSRDIADLGKNILIRVYDDVTNPTTCEKRSGVGMLDGTPQEIDLEKVIEADLSLTGQGRLRRHTV